jgi:gas vesicle protein
MKSIRVGEGCAAKFPVCPVPVTFALLPKDIVMPARSNILGARLPSGAQDAGLGLTYGLERPVVHSRALPNFSPKAATMQSSYAPASLRRSSRVPVNVPILVTSLEPESKFSEVCETLVVNAHGCSMRSPVKLDAGVLLHFHSKDGRETTAKVVYCEPLDSDDKGWRLGARLDRPQNFWGLKAAPQDWARTAVAESTGDVLTQKPNGKNIQPMAAGEKIPASLKTMLDSLQRQVAEERLRGLVSDAMRPLLSELAELREAVGRSQQPKEKSRFEVSLSHIPPELQDQIEARLRKELNPRVMEEARSQSAQVLEAAKTAIQKTTSASHTEFRERVSEDLRSVQKKVEGVSAEAEKRVQGVSAEAEKRVQGISAEMEKRVQAVSTETVTSLRDHLKREMGEFHQHMVDAGNRLKKLSDELLQVQQQTLAGEHDAHRQELDELQATVKSEAQRVQAEVADMDGRIAKLNESAHALESGLDIRLSKLATNTVSSARSQLESTVDVILQELGRRSAKELTEQVDEAAVRLGIIQKGIENAVSESMRLQAAGTLETFEKNLDDLSKKSVERCRGVLANGLNSLARSLGEQFRLDD